MRIFIIFVIRDVWIWGWFGLGWAWVGVRRGRGRDNITLGNIKLERESLGGKKTT
jgi:hypothetical protein